MTVQGVIRVCLAMILGCLLLRGHWSLLARAWKRRQKRRRAEQRKRARQDQPPKPFEGLTQRPVCDLCVAETEKPAGEKKRAPPPRIKRTRGRRPSVDTTNHFCPYQNCRYYGWLDRGNIISNGHPSGGHWRQLKCVACGKHFQETTGTVFYGSSLPAQDIMRAIATLGEGVNPRAVARIFGVDKDTVLRWLAEAAGHSEAVLSYMLHDLQLAQVQMDELYARLNGRSDAAGERLSCWVWTAIDPLSKLLVAVVVGDRSLERAQQLVHAVVNVLAPGVVPLFLTDQLAAYRKAVLTHFGCWVQRVSEKSGRTLQRWMPTQQLRYAQVKKRRRRWQVVGVTTQVVFGTKAAVKSALAAMGYRINTAFIERLNRTLRAHVPGLARGEDGLAKTEEGLLRRLLLVRGTYNFCLPHLSLRQALPGPVPTKGNGSPKKWLARTPAMAAGITAQVCSVGEFLLFRVPPWRQEATAA